MKIQDIINEADGSNAILIAAQNAFKGVPGVKITGLADAEIEDPSSGEVYIGFKLGLSYATARGAKSREVFKIWKDEYDEWHYLSDAAGGDGENLNDLLQQIAASAASAAKFHAKGPSIDYTRLMRR